MFEVEIDVDVAAVQGQRGRNFFLGYGLDLFPVFGFYFFLRNVSSNAAVGGDWFCGEPQVEATRFPEELSES